MVDFKNKTDSDLAKFLHEKREALRNFNFNIAGSKIRNVKEGVAAKKEIARVLTEMRKRTIK